MSAKIQWLLFTLALVSGSTAQAATYTVGDSLVHPTPHALYQANLLTHGDTIYLNEGDYRGTAALAVWQPNDLVIIGRGEVNLYADGQFIWGKGIWVARGDRLTVENVNFHNAAVPDRNGAGIRLDGSGLTVRHCGFYNNENGILTNNTDAGHVRVEYSEFDGSGFGRGQSHNIYVGRVDSFTFVGNWSHRANVGHQVKSRARFNHLQANRISDEEGASSRLIDLPNGGACTLIGNVLVQGPNAENQNLIGFGLEGYPEGYHRDLFLLNNTLVSFRRRALFLHIRAGANGVHLQNNLLVGPGDLTDGPIHGEEGGLWIEDVDSVGFVDPDAYDFRLKENSPAVDAGTFISVTLGNDSPEFLEYQHPLAVTDRPQDETVDVGAYEYVRATAVREPAAGPDLRVFPNPSRGTVHLLSSETNTLDYTIYDLRGSLVSQGHLDGRATLDDRHLPAGNYLLHVVDRRKGTATRRWLHFAR